MDFILRRGVKLCAHVYRLSWLFVDWLTKVWLMGFIFKAARGAVRPRVQPLLMVDWLITKVWLMVFIFEAGCEVVCPRVQPLLMVGWLITKVWLMDFIVLGGSLSGAHVYSLSWMLIDWLPRFDWWILYLRRGVKRCAHVYSLSCWLIDWLQRFDWWILYLRRGVKRCAHVYSLYWWLVDWLPWFDWWILYLRRGVKRCAHVYSLSWWLIDWLPRFDWWIFIYKAGREAVCPRVQPLLLPRQRVPRPVFQHRDHSHIQVSHNSLFFVKKFLTYSM